MLRKPSHSVEKRLAYALAGQLLRCRSWRLALPCCSGGATRLGGLKSGTRPCAKWHSRLSLVLREPWGAGPCVVAGLDAFHREDRIVLRRLHIPSR